MKDKRSYVLEIVKVSGIGSNWAIKATMGDEIRYRGYCYKKEAIKNMDTWIDCEPWYFPREFYHNFFSADELCLTEVLK